MDFDGDDINQYSPGWQDGAVFSDCDLLLIFFVSKTWSGIPGEPHTITFQPTFISFHDNINLQPTEYTIVRSAELMIMDHNIRIKRSIIIEHNVNQIVISDGYSPDDLNEGYNSCLTPTKIYGIKF